MKALPIDNISSTVFIYRIIMNIDRKLLSSDISAVGILHHYSPMLLRPGLIILIIAQHYTEWLLFEKLTMKWS